MDTGSCHPTHAVEIQELTLSSKTKQNRTESWVFMGNICSIYQVQSYLTFIQAKLGKLEPTLQRKEDTDEIRDETDVETNDFQV